MPIRKYRSVADMPVVQPGLPLDPENLRVACELSELVFALHGSRLEPGVRKYRLAGGGKSQPPTIRETPSGRRTGARSMKW